MGRIARRITLKQKDERLDLPPREPRTTELSLERLYLLWVFSNRDCANGALPGQERILQEESLNLIETNWWQQGHNALPDIDQGSSGRGSSVERQA